MRSFTAMFTADPFNIAPRAPRQTRGSWFALAFGFLFAAFCAWPLADSVQAFRQAERISSEQRRAQREQLQKDAAARQDQQSPAFLEKMKAQQKLQQILRMSWSGLFDALESAGREVDGGTAILSLVPIKTQAEAAQVDITALAVSTHMMVEYLRALEKNPAVREVQLSTQQPGAGAGIELVRFQFSILWEPKRTVAAQAPIQPHLAAQTRPVQ